MWSQNPKEISGNKYFLLFDYETAIVHYQKAESLSLEGKRNLRMCYLKQERYTDCEKLAAAIVLEPDHNSDDIFEYVKILRTNKKYNDADNWMKKYESLVGSDNRVLAEKLFQSRITDLTTDNGNISIINLDFNTEKIEFAPIIFENKLVFTSTNAERGQENYTNNASKQDFLRLFMIDTSRFDGNKRTLVNNKLNSKYNEAVACFSEDLNLMIFTGNDLESIEPGKKINVQLFFVKKDISGNWGQPIPFKYNDRDFSFGHPFLANQGKTLFFASNKPGTIGGSDIWKCEWINGDWSEPINLGNQVNTESNEFYPFFSESSNSLFFASDGRGGLGGLDLFVSSIGNNGFQLAQNLGSPINSNMDDFSFVTNSDMSKGYFASNRTGGKGKDDIYAFKMTELWTPQEITRTIAGTIIDDTGKPLPNTSILFLVNDLDTLTTVFSDNKGCFTVSFENHVSGKIIVGSVYGKTFDEFIFKKDSISMTKNYQFNKPKESEPLKPFDNKSKPIFFETAKWDLDEQDINTLNYFISSLNADQSLKVSISGFADVRYTKEANEYWSKMRMLSAKEYLLNNGIDPSRISGNYFGETSQGIDENLKRCNCNSNNLSLCRRVDLQLFR